LSKTGFDRLGGEINRLSDHSDYQLWSTNITGSVPLFETSLLSAVLPGIFDDDEFWQTRKFINL
jgi:hypothetical protein